MCVPKNDNTNLRNAKRTTRLLEIKCERIVLKKENSTKTIDDFTLKLDCSANAFLIQQPICFRNLFQQTGSEYLSLESVSLFIRSTSHDQNNSSSLYIAVYF